MVHDTLNTMASASCFGLGLTESFRPQPRPRCHMFGLGLDLILLWPH